MTDAVAAYETGWTLATWLGLSMLGLVAAVLLILSPFFAVLLDEIRGGAAVLLWLLLGISLLVSCAFLFWLPGAMMRHVPDQANVSWVVIGFLIVAAVLGFRGLMVRDGGPVRWVLWGPAVMIVVGVVVGAVVDGLERAAAMLSMGVGALGILVVGVVVLMGLAAIGNARR